MNATTLGGLCPACVRRVALTGPDSDDGEAGPAAKGAWTPPPVAELAVLLPPETYVVESLVGRGGMGAVYRARQLRLDRIVAIKVMRHDHRAGLEFIERFRREALTLAKLSHPNIVSVIDSGEAGPELLYLVMEFVDGADLLQIIRSGGMSQERALQVVPQICDALQFAHEHGIVHRDIKPSNVLVTRDGRVKIADFGLAKPFDRESGPQTRTGVGLGTPDYAAPEQFQPGAAVDHRADIYALGVMMYEMLTGGLPRGAWAPPSKSAAVDARWDAIVTQALQAKPDDRHRSATEVKTAVTEIADGPPPSVRPRWLVPVCVALGLALMAGWHFSRPAPTPASSIPALVAGVTSPAIKPVGYGQPLLFGGHRYELVDGHRTWEQARVEAERRGGHLATLTSREENDAITRAFSGVLDWAHASVWIGGTRRDTNTMWQWVTGEPFAFTDWHPGEPNSTDFPAYLVLWRHSLNVERFNWNDDPLGSRGHELWRGFLIEWDNANPPPPPKTGSHLTATREMPFTNSLGMKFLPVTATAAGHPVHFSVWETRNRDYAAYAAARIGVNMEWKTTAGLPIGPDHPVVMLNWTDAVAFCHWLTDHERAKGSIGPYDTYRLPTDREWSAAVGLTNETGATPRERNLKTPGFPWGSAWPPPEGAGNFADASARELPAHDPVLQLAWVREYLGTRHLPGYRDGFATTAPVGSFPPNALGLHDLSGNVWEWCADRFLSNPTDRTRVVRGGSWTDGMNDKGALHSSHRFDGNPSPRYAFRGFRVVLEVGR